MLNGGNPDEKLIDYKDAAKTLALEYSQRRKAPDLNHFKGGTTTFHCYGNAGRNKLDKEGRSDIASCKEYCDPPKEPFDPDRNAHAPSVWQCRYSDIGFRYLL